MKSSNQGRKLPLKKNNSTMKKNLVRIAKEKANTGRIRRERSNNKMLNREEKKAAL